MSIASPEIPPASPPPGDFGVSAGELPEVEFPPSPARRARWGKSTLACVGIDVSVEEVRVVRLDCEAESQQPVRWKTACRIPLPGADGGLTPERLTQVVERVCDGLPRCIDGEVNQTVISLPIDWTHYQTTLGSDLKEVRRRCDEMFLASVFQSPAHVCHWPVVGAHHGIPCGEDQYVVAGISERLACQFAHSISAVGYDVKAIVPQGVAMAHHAVQLTGVDAQSIVWLDRGSSLIAVRHRSGAGLSRTLPPVPDVILEQESYDRPLDCYALRPYLTEISNELVATSRFAARADMSRVSPQPILLAGPLAEIEGVDEVIATIAETPVAVWSYLHSNRPPTPTRFSHLPDSAYRRKDARFAAALSLAMAAQRSNRRGYVE